MGKKKLGHAFSVVGLSGFRYFLREAMFVGDLITLFVSFSFRAAGGVFWVLVHFLFVRRVSLLLS